MTKQNDGYTISGKPRTAEVAERDLHAANPRTLKICIKKLQNIKIKRMMKFTEIYFDDALRLAQFLSERTGKEIVPVEMDTEGFKH